MIDVADTAQRILDDLKMRAAIRGEKVLDLSQFLVDRLVALTSPTKVEPEVTLRQTPVKIEGPYPDPECAWHYCVRINGVEHKFEGRWAWRDAMKFVRAQ